MEPPAVSILHLAKRYGAVAAVSDVSFEVHPSEVFGLIGPNGAGKTTTLECLLGLCTPDAGRILIQGVDARSYPEQVKTFLGAHLQDSSLPDAMAPRQALRLCAQFYRKPADPDELLKRFGLSGKASSRVSALSSGQRQRLALALAFVNEPRIVVLDEPTAGLDPAARMELHGLIAAQRAKGCAILFTTHYLEEARTLCDRIGIMDRGRMLAVGTPEELIARSGARPRIVVQEPTLDEVYLELARQ